MSNSLALELAPYETRLETLFAEKLGLKHGAFQARAAKARRRLPRHLRPDLDRLVEARELVGKPKLEAQADRAGIAAGTERVARHLEAIDVADRRRGRWLGILGGLMFNLLILAALVLVVLRWRGLI